MTQVAANDAIAQQAQVAGTIARERVAPEYDGSEAREERRTIVGLLAFIGMVLGWVAGTFQGWYYFPAGGQSLQAEGNWYDAIIWTLTAHGYALAGAGLGAIAGVLLALLALLTLDRIYTEGHHKA